MAVKAITSFNTASMVNNSTYNNTAMQVPSTNVHFGNLTSSVAKSKKGIVATAAALLTAATIALTGCGAASATNADGDEFSSSSTVDTTEVSPSSSSVPDTVKSSSSVADTASSSSVANTASSSSQQVSSSSAAAQSSSNAAEYTPEVLATVSAVNNLLTKIGISSTNNSILTKKTNIAVATEAIDLDVPTGTVLQENISELYGGTHKRTLIKTNPLTYQDESIDSSTKEVFNDTMTVTSVGDTVYTSTKNTLTGKVLNEAYVPTTNGIIKLDIDANDIEYFITKDSSGGFDLTYISESEPFATGVTATFVRKNID